MRGCEACRKLLESVLEYSSADQTEVLYYGETSGLTRFANNHIHQNVSETDAVLQVRVVFGQKIGLASINKFDEQSLKRVVETAMALARYQRDNPEFKSLPSPGEYQPVTAFFETTAGYSPGQRAGQVSIVCRKAAQAGLIAAGALSTGSSELAVANSLGLFAHFPSTMANLVTVVMSESGSGYADFYGMDVGILNTEAVADEAVNKALRGRNPVDLEPGEYEVILEEYAVADMLGFIAYLGFSAQAVQERRSFMTDKLGQRVMSESISIWDDAFDQSGIIRPFDFEGVPKQRVNLIEGGIAAGVVYDSYTAGKEGKQSTGHALPAGNTLGPMPMNMFMQPGEATKDEMLAKIKRGIWVTRFWYTRPMHPLTVLVTGMTRDGTFLIENGEIVRPVKNLRFTQSYVEALSNVVNISSNTKLTGDIFHSRVPALHLGKFKFSGVSSEMTEGAG